MRCWYGFVIASIDCRSWACVIRDVGYTYADCDV
jgi:hypothetical protein